MKADLYSAKHKKVGSVDLPDGVFAETPSLALLWEQVKAQRASRRRGTHDTKTRAQVQGGGTKPWRQKGSGRARHGSNRSPIWVGGGTVFGPHPRDYSYRLPRSARRAALRAALSLRAKENALMMVEAFELEQGKTQEAVALLETLGAKSALLVDVGNDKLKQALRNLPHSKYVEAKALNVYDILDHETLVLTQAALGCVIKRSELAGATGAD